MFSNTVEYALRAVVWLAAHPGEPQTTQQIADDTRTPPGYLSKVLQALTRARIVRSRRGMYGGFTLERPADQITVLDVINAVDRIQRIRVCPLGLETHGPNLCALHRRMDDALASIEKALANSRISEMVAHPMCIKTPGADTPTEA